jgi:Cu+-exporting ATPase
MSEESFWRLFGVIESSSDHPLAHAVSDFVSKKAEGDENWRKMISNIEEISGRGISCSLVLDANKKVIVGNELFIRENGINIDKDLQSCLDDWKDNGCSLVIFGICGDSSETAHVLGAVGIADEIRPETKEIVEQLHKKNIKVWMITGDNQKTANSVAHLVGIPPNHILAQVMPEQKYEKVLFLQDQSKISYGGSVAMVGDGINDAVALAQADVGIAIGAGSDVAVEAADVVLVKSNLKDVLNLIDMSQTVLQRIRLNFFWAFGYNCLGIPLAAGFLFNWGITLDPMFAGLAMALSSVSVICSSLLLQFYHQKY